MSTVVRPGNLVEIPQEILHALNLREGSEVEWEATLDGKAALSEIAPKSVDPHPLRGFLVPYLKPGESGMASFLRWREEERELNFARERRLAGEPEPES